MTVLPIAPVPDNGSVLGVDVGFSEHKRSSAVCRLDWTRDAVTWTIGRFRAVEPERYETLRRFADRPLLAAAFDGPLQSGLGLIGRYRLAEQKLTRGLGRIIGQPGSSASPVGRKLNAATNACAHIVRATGHVAQARHAEAIDDRAIVEAFPSSWLGLMIAAPQMLACRRGNRSDVYYAHLAATGGLDTLLEHVLPGRRAPAFTGVTNHDDRAALICALTALGLVAGDYRAVGDDVDGWIILPPRALLAAWAAPLSNAWWRSQDAEIG